MAPIDDSATPAASIAAPDIAAPAQPDLSGLSTPAPAAPPPAPVQAPAATLPNAGSNISTLSQMQPFEQKAQAATQRAADLANAPVIDKTVPHARLLAVIRGISEGLSAFGTAAATGGREGGAPEVAQLQAADQARKIQAQQAAEAQKNSQIQNQLMVADTNHKLAQNIFLMATLPDQMTKAHTEAQQATQNLAGGEADFRTGHGGMNQDEFNKALADTTPVGTQPNSASSFFKSSAQQVLQAANKTLGVDDPYVKSLQTALNNPQATPKDLWMAKSQVESQQGYQDAAAKRQKDMEEANQNAPFGNRAAGINEAMTARYQVLNPGKPLPSSLAMSASSTPKDFDRADKILQQTETAQATQANRDIVNGMRQQTIAMSGAGPAMGDTSLSGDAYLQSLPATERSLVSSVGAGKTAPERMSQIIARNPRLLQEVTLAFPDFDSSKAAAYPALYKDFTTGKTAVALNAGGTALGHLYELQQLNTPMSHIAHTPAWTAYQNKAATVSTELAKFYGDATVPAIEHIQQTLTSTLPGNRDAAIRTQAQSMGDKLDAFEQQWKSGAPSKAYEAEMPQISPAAKAARAKLDPKYAAAQQPAGSATAPKFVRPANVPAGSKLMQVPGGQPHWMTPDKIAAAQKAGAVEVQ